MHVNKSEKRIILNRKLSDSIKKAEIMCEEGADIIDIGGESSRPGALAVDKIEEQNRIIPVIKELSKRNITVSCDTKNAITMEKGDLILQLK